MKRLHKRKVLHKDSWRALSTQSLWRSGHVAALCLRTDLTLCLRLSLCKKRGTRQRLT